MKKPETKTLKIQHSLNLGQEDKSHSLYSSNGDTEPKGAGIFDIQHAKTLMKSVFLDAAFVFCFYTYYNVMTPYSQSYLEYFSSSLPLKLAGLLLAAVLFWIAPTIIYTVFKAIKIPALATGRIEGMPSLMLLFSTNLKLSMLSFVCYSLFEILGEALQPVLVPYIAGCFLFLSLTLVWMWAAVSHSLIWKGECYPLRCALKDPKGWKAGIKWIILSVVLVVIVNIGIYLIPSQQTTQAYLTAGTVASAIIPSILMNIYQLRLY